MILPPEKIFQKVKALCLKYPGINQTDSWGHPNFRAGKKAFVTFEKWEGRPSIAFRVENAEKEKLLRGDAVFVTPYGRGKWMSLWIDKPLPSWRDIEALVARSYRLVTPAPRPAGRIE